MVKPYYEENLMLDYGDGLVHHVYEEDKDEQGRGWESACDPITAPPRAHGPVGDGPTCFDCMYFVAKWSDWRWRK
jgi:hypothetical protein